MANFRLQPGYCFLWEGESRDKSGHLECPRPHSDSWEISICSADECERAVQVGKRTIDGSPCRVFWVGSGRGDRFIAQTEVSCQVFLKSTI